MNESTRHIAIEAFQYVKEALEYTLNELESQLENTDMMNPSCICTLVREYLESKYFNWYVMWEKFIEWANPKTFKGEPVGFVKQGNHWAMVHINDSNRGQVYWYPKTREYIPERIEVVKRMLNYL